jgi:VanZ family protein
VKQFSSFLKYQFPALLWCLTIFGLSAIRRVPVIRFPIQVDKVVHTVLFGILCFLAWRAFFFQPLFPRVREKAMTLAFVFSCLYGISDELHQLFVPGRSADVYDAIADAAGALIVITILWLRAEQKKQSGEDRVMKSNTS